MNIIDKFYYSLQKDNGPFSKVAVGMLFTVMGFAGLILLKLDLPHSLGALAMFLLGIASFLSVHTLLPGWNIDSDRFPNGVRKIIIIILQFTGLISIISAFVLQLFIS